MMAGNALYADRFGDCCHRKELVDPEKYITARGRACHLKSRRRGTRSVTVQIVNASGITLLSQVISVRFPSTTLSIAVPKPAPGLYFLKVVSASGESAVKSWNAF